MPFSEFFQQTHDWVNNSLNTLADNMRTPVPLYSQRALFLLSGIFFFLFLSYTASFTPALIFGFGLTAISVIAGSYSLEILLTPRDIFNDLTQFWQELFHAFARDRYLSPFMWHWLLEAPFERLMFLGRLVSFGVRINLIPGRDSGLLSKATGLAILCFTIFGLSAGVGYLSLPQIGAILLNNSLFSLSMHSLSLSVCPEFWNQGLNNFIGTPTLTRKALFLCNHLLFPLNNVYLMLDRLPGHAGDLQLPAYNHQPFHAGAAPGYNRQSPRPVFPGVGQRLGGPEREQHPSLWSRFMSFIRFNPPRDEHVVANALRL